MPRAIDSLSIARTSRGSGAQADTSDARVADDAWAAIQPLMQHSLGTGFAITIESWVAVYRERSLLNMGTAAWNTFAQIHNTIGAVQNMGSAFGAVGDAFKSAFDFSGDDDDAKIRLAIIGILIMVAIVSVSLLGGALITAAIIQRYAGTVTLPARNVVYVH